MHVSEAISRLIDNVRIKLQLPESDVSAMMNGRQNVDFRRLRIRYGIARAIQNRSMNWELYKPEAEVDKKNRAC